MDAKPASSLLDPATSSSDPNLSRDPSAVFSRNDAASSAPAPGTSPTTTQFAQRVPISPTMASVQSASGHARRRSVAETLRNIPPSPRQRQPSVTQAAAQELNNFPPMGQRTEKSKFAGKEWRELTLKELLSEGEVSWADMTTTVEEATKLLQQSQDNVVLIRDSSSSSQTATSTFDYTDLLTYLLVVVGLAKPEEDQVDLFNNIAKKMQNGESVVLSEIQALGRKESLIMLPANDGLSQAIEMLGSGIHQLLVTGEDGNIVGVLSQLRVMNFFWNEGVNFPSIDRLYPVMLRDLSSTLGQQSIISINSDSPLKDALVEMYNEGLSSIAVVDNGQNVVGNISTKDVRHLTHGSNAPLLSSSCMHFISVILAERGMENGQDAFPVFYVNPLSTLAHTVAKLVATGSQRMWVVDADSKSPPQPATPAVGPVSGSGSGSISGPSGGPPASPVPHAAVPASAMAGAGLSGKLNGVISLTDILNMFAKYTGLHPSDPGEQRARRRRSSSSVSRPSIDAGRSSVSGR